MKHVWVGGASRSRGSAMSSFHRGLAVACLAINLVGAPVSGALADEGFMGIQYEFALGKKLKLRQVNLTFKPDISLNQGFDFEHARPAGIAIPLYSTDPRMPALLNYLSNSDAGGEGKSKVTAGAVIGVVLGVGILGLLVYAAGKCANDTFSVNLDESKQDDRACDSLSSGAGGLGGLS